MSGLTFTRVGKNFFRSDDDSGKGAGPYSVWVKTEAKGSRKTFQRLWMATFQLMQGAEDVDLGSSWTSAGDGMEACRQHHAATVPTIDLMAALKASLARQAGP